MQICKYILLAFPSIYRGFCWNIKGLEIVNQMNAWKKCSCSKWRNVFQRKIYQIFCLKGLSGNCLGAVVWRVIILGTIIQVPIVRGQFFWDHCLGAILSWGAIVVGGNCPGGNYPGGNCPKTTIMGSTKLI